MLRSAVMGALLVAAATPAAAQEGGRERGEKREFVSVEAALRLRESNERIELQSRVAAGQIEREEVRKQMESKREDMRKMVEQRQAQLDNILSDEQLEQLKRTPRERGERMREKRGPGRAPGTPPAPGTRGIR